ncbi:MAG TPA: hypothetical protein VFV50_15475 [Bdellovibrionales bacterium]|nr:hypothetical protein [Bdellovibrionales bacterium]
MMKRLVLAAMVTMLCSGAFAMERTNIVCGDVQKAYVEMDLSAQFKSDYRSTVEQYGSAGYDVAFAGRNCGVGSYVGNPEFEVLLLMKRTHPMIRDLLGPMGIISAEIEVLNSTSEALLKGVVLVGTRGRLVNQAGETVARLSLRRVKGWDDVVLIIRQKK